MKMSEKIRRINAMAKRFDLPQSNDGSMEVHCKTPEEYFDRLQKIENDTYSSEIKINLIDGLKTMSQLGLCGIGAIRSIAEIRDGDFEKATTTIAAGVGTAMMIEIAAQIAKGSQRKRILDNNILTGATTITAIYHDDTVDSSEDTETNETDISCEG